MPRRDAPEPPGGPPPGRPDESDAESAVPPPPGRLQRIVRKLWWLHSSVGLVFGVSVMLVARRGLAYADKLLLFLPLSWLLMFAGVRLVVGPSRTAPEDRLAKRGLRLVTNYFIKNLYQQMFYFLVPLYAGSATWSFDSPNFWVAPLLLVCAVLSTLDIVFDHFVMRKRLLAASLYGVCLFGVLNLMLPLAAGLTHFEALLVAAAATAPAVALLTFPVRSLVRAQGFLLVTLASAVLVGLAWWRPQVIPPAPLAATQVGVGHGNEGDYELVPGAQTRIGTAELARLRCASLLSQPGGLHDAVVHVWRFRGQEWARLVPTQVATGGRVSGYVLRSYLKRMPEDPTGKWECRIETAEGQWIGRVRFEVVAQPEVAPVDGADAAH